MKNFAEIREYVPDAHDKFASAYLNYIHANLDKSPAEIRQAVNDILDDVDQHMMQDILTSQIPGSAEV